MTAARSMMTLLVAVALALVAAPSAGAQDTPVDCADFANQAAAQAALRADPTDPAENDADDDGIACELYDYADATTDLVPVAAAVGGSDGATAAATATATTGGTGGTSAMPSAGIGPLDAAGGLGAGAAGFAAALLGLAVVAGVFGVQRWRRAW